MFQSFSHISVFSRACNEDKTILFSAGHYVRKIWMDEKYYITPAADSDKDQSFFLWGLKQDILRRMLLPMGGNDENRKHVLLLLREGLKKPPLKKTVSGSAFARWITVVF